IYFVFTLLSAIGSSSSSLSLAALMQGSTARQPQGGGRWRGCSEVEGDDDQGQTKAETIDVRARKAGDYSAGSKRNLLEYRRNQTDRVVEIVSVGCSLRQRYQDVPAGLKRCLKLSMTDGVKRVIGMEYRPIKDLEFLAPAGFKDLQRDSSASSPVVVVSATGGGPKGGDLQIQPVARRWWCWLSVGFRVAGCRWRVWTPASQSV
ncbi:recQ-mediated genome instability protein 1, partial [Dionaea muscipula]